MYDTNSAPNFLASRREPKAASASPMFEFTALERRVLMCGDSALGAELMGPVGPAHATATLAASSPLSSVPILHSRPTAAKLVYLDFVGDANDHATPAYDQDGDP